MKTLQSVLDRIEFIKTENGNSTVSVKDKNKARKEIKNLNLVRNYLETNPKEESLKRQIKEINSELARTRPFIDESKTKELAKKEGERWELPKLRKQKSLLNSS